MSVKVYVLEEYAFYDSSTILMISNRYDDVKKYFDEIVNLLKTGYGYTIYEYELGSKYSFTDTGENKDWVEIGYDGSMRTIK